MKYKLDRQETAYFCYVACLQAILRNYGIQLTQREIAKQIGCNKRGVRDLQLVKNFLNRNGLEFESFSYDEVPFNEPDFLLQDNLERNVDVLINKPKSKGECHALLLEDFSFPILSVAEPKKIKRYSLDLYFLVRKMYKEKRGRFDLVRKL